MTNWCHNCNHPHISSFSIIACWYNEHLMPTMQSPTHTIFQHNSRLMQWPINVTDAITHICHLDIMNIWCQQCNHPHTPSFNIIAGWYLHEPCINMHQSPSCLSYVSDFSPTCIMQMTLPNLYLNYLSTKDALYLS